MYEHPIKQAGLSMNRILFSNTMMVMGGFPNAKAQQFSLSFKYRTFENGKSTSTQCKCLIDEAQSHRQASTSSILTFCLCFNCRLQC